MWQNYLKTALRSIWRYKAYSAINIFGLTLGIACCLLIILYVQYEFSFDQYHSKADRIYRVSLHGVLAGNEINAATTPYPMAATLLREFPEVESAARFRKFFRDTLVTLESTRYMEQKIFHADANLFELFDFEFLAGDPDTALTDPFSVAISASTARKYFGRTEALGRMLNFNGQTDYRITGVFQDVPDNSHFHADFLVSFTSDSNHDSPIWISNNIQTYLLVRPGTSIPALTEKLEDLVRKYVAPQIEQALGINVEEFFNTGGSYGFRLQALKDIHLYSQLEGEIEQNGNADYVYTFLAIAAFILLLACVNYINLSTARSANRAREIGMRKVMGARRDQLTMQFLCESVVVTLCAMLLAIPLVLLFLPPFSALTERTLTAALLLNPFSLATLCVFLVIIGVMAGSYPALYLSKFSPQAVLKGKLSVGVKNSWLRSVLVVIQFAISIALVSATFIVYAQLDYMRNKPLGFDKERVLVINRGTALGDSLESFLDQVRSQSGVVSASYGVHVPGMQVDQNVYVLEGAPSTDTKALWSSTVGYGFIETLKFEMLAGRTFSRDFGDDESAYIINESAALELGIANPTQHRLFEPGPSSDQSNTGQIIGVVRDFHFESLHQEIRPMVFRLRGFARYIVVRIDSTSMLPAISEIQDTWRRLTNDEPFDYSFLDVDFDNLHKGDQRMGVVFVIFAALAIIIACLGLYGLASYTTQQRTREIGIRKTLGASLGDVVLLMSRDFMWLVGCAIVVAVPLAYLAMNWWLQLFSYRIDMPPIAFINSSVIAVVIAFVTVSVQSVATGLQNPTTSLREE